MTVLEKIMVLIVTLSACCFAGKLFYDSIISGIVLAVPAYYPAGKVYVNLKRKKRQKEFERQFEEALSSLVSALRTGYSVENAFVEITRQLELIYGREAYIIKELRVICHGLSVNIPIEKLVNDMAVRTRVSAVSEFADVLVTAKRNGGNFIEITKRHADILHEKRQVINEIEAAVSAKKYESIVMNIMPAGMLVYLRLTSGNFVEPLYSGIISRLVMTALLCLYIAAIAVGKRITDFQHSGSAIKKMPAVGKKMKKGGGSVMNVVSSKIYSVMKSTVILPHIDRINNDIRTLNINVRNRTVIEEFWNDMIKKELLGIAVSSVIVLYAASRDSDNIIFYIIILAAVIYVIPYSVINGLKAKAEKRKNQMMLDYPELTDKLSLLIGAGLSIKGCFIKMAGEYAAKRKKGIIGYHYVYEEIIYMARQLENGRSESVVYEEFGKRSGILPYMKLCTMLVQNLKKGSRDVLDKLRMTSLDALVERRNLMKKMGERASSKLLLPMMMQFIMIIVMIMYPAVVSM